MLYAVPQSQVYKCRIVFFSIRREQIFYIYRKPVIGAFIIIDDGSVGIVPESCGRIKADLEIKVI